MNTLDKKSCPNRLKADVQASEQEYAGHPLPDAHDPSAPRKVIRGQSNNNHSNTPADAAITDWVDFTFPLEDSQQAINYFFRSLIVLTGIDFTPLTSRGKGFHGWHRSYSLGKTSAIFAIGGQRGRAVLSLPGSACVLIPDKVWPDLIGLIRDEYQGRITRWDGAADDYEGVHDIEWALQQHAEGGFKSGGNRPRVSIHGDWINNEGRGRTIYIGSRKNGKLIRIYEKGKQLGDVDSKWVRWELELRRKDRDIPWDVLTMPGQYVAGAYPCMNWVHEKASKVKTYKEIKKISCEHLISSASQSYGQLVNYMLEMGVSKEKIIEKIRRDGVPARLEIPLPPEMLEEG